VARACVELIRFNPARSAQQDRRGQQALRDEDEQERADDERERVIMGGEDPLLAREARACRSWRIAYPSERRSS
jgi:hypothetical protein